MSELILASGSSARRKLLEEAGIAFTARPSGVDETPIKQAMKGAPIGEVAMALARAKAAAVSRGAPEAYVLGSDQICELQGKVLDKPGTHARAVETLRALRGNAHTQHCAAVIFHRELEIWSAYETATLTMRELSDAEIETYLQQDRPYGCAGSYQFETAAGRALFEHITGTRDVIMGLTIASLKAFLS